MGAHAWTMPPAATRPAPDTRFRSWIRIGCPNVKRRPDEPAPAAAVAAPPSQERRGRDVWETLLLVLLFIGVVAAALWALFSNGVFSPGL